MKKTIEQIVTPIATRYRVLGKLASGNTPALVANGYRWRRDIGVKAYDAFLMSLTTSNPPHYYGKDKLGKPDEYGRRHVPATMIEGNVRSIGVRNITYADGVLDYLHHEGWFTEDDGVTGEVYRGVALALPHGRWLAGYHDVAGDYYVVDFSMVYTEETDAARRGDQMAEADAAEACEYNRQYSDATLWVDIIDELGGQAEVDRLRRIHAETKEVRERLETLIDIEERFPDVTTYAKENL